FHADDNSDRIYSVQVQDKKAFSVLISHTCVDDFDYTLHSVEKPVAPDKQNKAADALHPLGDKVVTITFDNKYSGYVLLIRHKPNVTKSSCPTIDSDSTAATLNDVALTIGVSEQRWDLSISGGFSFSGLTDPVYALKDVAGSTTQKMVVDDSADKQDQVHLGV